MKAQLNALIVGICIVLAAALVAGAATFPQVMGIIASLIFWVVAIVIIGVIILFGILVLFAWANS
jgi:hypothetical protein